jgi:hypothetical protein
MAYELSNCVILLNLRINMNTNVFKFFHITTINKIKYVKYMMAKEISIIKQQILWKWS